MGRRYENTFPLPPSVNHIWRNVKGRTFISKEYRAWMRAVDAYALLKTRFEMSGDVRASYDFGKPSKIRMDVCNREKGVSDALQRWGILKDDSQLVDVRLRWADDVAPGMVRVLLEEIA